MPFDKHSPRIHDFMEKIAAKFPAARDFDPCPCGTTFAVIPKKHVQGPELHFVVDDAELRAEAIRIIKEQQRAECAYEGPDAVLILSEVA